MKYLQSTPFSVGSTEAYRKNYDNVFAKKEEPVTNVVSYSLGFVFTPGFQHVLLIEKYRPEWQRDKLNGIGGHIEPGETPENAMIREFSEETAGMLSQKDLRTGFTFFARLSGKHHEFRDKKFQIFLFYAELKRDISFEHFIFGETEEGVVNLVATEDLAELNTVSLVDYLIPLAISHAKKKERAKFIDIKEYENVCEFELDE